MNNTIHTYTHLLCGLLSHRRHCHWMLTRHSLWLIINRKMNVKNKTLKWLLTLNSCKNVVDKWPDKTDRNCCYSFVVVGGCWCRYCDEMRMENILKTDKLFWRKIDSASEWIKKRHRENWIWWHKIRAKSIFRVKIVVERCRKDVCTQTRVDGLLRKKNLCRHSQCSR